MLEYKFYLVLKKIKKLAQSIYHLYAELDLIINFSLAWKEPMICYMYARLFMQWRFMSMSYINEET